MLGNPGYESRESSSLSAPNNRPTVDVYKVKRGVEEQTRTVAMDEVDVIIRSQRSLSWRRG